MRSNRLQLNTAKTEVLWCVSSRRQHQVPQNRVQVDEDIIPATSVRKLVVYFYSHISMRTHVLKTVSCCFAILCQIRSIRRSISRPVLQMLVASLVLSGLDYVMLRWPVYHVTSWTDCHPCLTPLDGSSSQPGKTTM